MNDFNAPKAVEIVGCTGFGSADFSVALNRPKNGFRVVVYDVDSTKVPEGSI
jgi:hypothetical protein